MEDNLMPLWMVRPSLLFSMVLVFTKHALIYVLKNKFPMKNIVTKISWFADYGWLARVWFELIHVPTALLWRLGVRAHPSWQSLWTGERSLLSPFSLVLSCVNQTIGSGTLFRSLFYTVVDRMFIGQKNWSKINLWFPWIFVPGRQRVVHAKDSNDYR